MAAEALAAVRAYAEAARRSGGGASEVNATEAAGTDFSAMVGDAIRETQSQLSEAETLTQKAATGQVELVDVATAVAAAEVSLETVVALRDQVVQAYQEILRMPI